MLKKFIDAYLISLLIALTIFIALMALNPYLSSLNVIYLVLGCLLGVFLLDLDYVLYAYFYDPEVPFSKTLRGYIAHKDFKNAIHHIYYNKSEVKEKSLNSALFQVVLAGAAIFTAASTAGILVKALVLVAFGISIYKMINSYFDGTSKEWFWAFKKVPNKDGIKIYTVILVGILILSVGLV